MISIEKCSDYSENKLLAALSKTFDNLGGIEKYIKAGTKVAIKPNLVMKKSPEDAATTHPQFIKAVALLVKKAGGIVTVVESPGGLYSQNILKGVYSACGITEISRDAGINLNYDTGLEDVKIKDGLLLKSVTVLKPLVEADVIINLPKLKTHGQMVYTGAVKNMFGAVPGAMKAELHLRLSDYDRFADALIDVYLSVKPILNIMDAVVGMDGKGPTAGKPKHIGLVIAGESGFEVDLAAVAVVKANPFEVPLLRQAMNRKLCPENLNEVEILGEKISGIEANGFQIPHESSLKALQFYDKGIMKHIINYLRPKPVFNHKTCVGCSECAKCCPASIIEMKNKRPRADLSKCIRCFCCQELCPAKAVDIKRVFLSKVLLKKQKNTNEKKDFCR